MVKVMYNKLIAKVPASSILEVVVSMAVIVCLIGIALMILSNVTRFALSVKKLKASALLQEELIKVNASHEVVDGILKINGVQIEKSFKPYSAGNNLLEVDLVAYDQNKVLIAQFKSVIVHDTN